MNADFFHTCKRLMSSWPLPVSVFHDQIEHIIDVYCWYDLELGFSDDMYSEFFIKSRDFELICTKQFKYLISMNQSYLQRNMKPFHPCRFQILGSSSPLHQKERLMFLYDASLVQATLYSFQMYALYRIKSKLYRICLFKEVNKYWISSKSVNYDQWCLIFEIDRAELHPVWSIGIPVSLSDSSNYPKMCYDLFLGLRDADRELSLSTHTRIGCHTLFNHFVYAGRQINTIIDS